MATNSESATLRSIGNWDLFERIADSGMGTLYNARNRISGELVTVKLLPPFRAGQEQAFQRFARECRILSALRDPHIVRAMEFGIEGTEPYLVMEYVEGERLSERVAREGPLPEAEAVRLITEVAGALGRVHERKLIHRNVKPDSILITPDGEARLTDLCLIKEVEAREAVTRDGTWLGTPNFIAPEQFRNAGKATRWCDVYSLAATLYMAVTGAPPYAGCNLIDMCARKLRDELVPPRQLVPTLTERTDLAIRRAMSAQPDKRPATCEEFIANLLGTGEPAATESAVRSSPEVVCVPEAPAGAAALGDVQGVDRAPRRADDTMIAGDDEDGGSSFWVWLVAVATIAGFMSGLAFLSGVFH
jgi:serine/threonine protein kinase